MIPALGALDFATSGLRGVASGPSTAPAAGQTAESFAAALAEMTNRAVDTLASAEQLSVQGIQGQADTRTVVDAVMNAEQTLQAAVAIRDKIISAYLEISRMAI